MKNRALHAWLLRRWYGKRPVVYFVPLSAIFIGMAALRRMAFRYGWLRTVKLPVPVMVVGNISVGGTGKTPMVIWLAAALRARGFRPGIVTRGYGGHAHRWPVAVTADSDPAQVGDEAVLLARRTDLPVAAGPERVAAARLLLQNGSVNVILSDDGLQHYRLRRDLEVIMLDGERGLGNGWRLPAGPLRESARRLTRAALVIAKRGAAPAMHVPEGAIEMRLGVETVASLDGRHRLPLASFHGQPVHALAGIGHPQQFFALLTAHGLRVQAHALPDHARLSPADLKFDDDAPVFITEKDAIKCRGFALPNCWCVSVTAEFAEPDAELILARVSRKLTDAPQPAGSG